MEINYIEPLESDRILFVNIKNSYNCTDKKSMYYRESAYEATRKYWKVSSSRVSKVNLVVGHVDGIVKVVIEPTQSYPTQDTRFKGRYEFDGEQLFDSSYLGKSIHNLVRIGQNPINYFNV
ncbi:MAG: hypothetical protein RR259_11235 [Odoribacter sp.]